MLAVLTDGSGNLLPHTVTPLDVTTVARCCRQTQNLLEPAECQQQQCKHHSGCGQQVSLLTELVLEVSTVCLLQISAFNRILPCGLAAAQI
jgi:hypothetical protein